MSLRSTKERHSHGSRKRGARLLHLLPCAGAHSPVHPLHGSREQAGWHMSAQPKEAIYFLATWWGGGLSSLHSYGMLLLPGSCYWCRLCKASPLAPPQCSLCPLHSFQQFPSIVGSDSGINAPCLGSAMLGGGCFLGGQRLFLLRQAQVPCSCQG